MPASHRPSPPDVPLATWRELLDAALALRAARPWEWLDDMDVFALVDEQKRAWFPSVLGAAGQVYGLALYRGENGLRFLLETAETLEDDPQAAMFVQDALLLDWGAKKALAPEDLATLAALGHAPRPRERQAWPSFRSHVPGWYPWFLDATEARALARGTRAALACAELARRDPDFFAPNDADPSLLPTVDLEVALAGNLTPQQVAWRTWETGPLVAPAIPPVPPTWAAIRARPQNTRAAVEFDVFHLPAPVSDGGRPYFPRMALMADGESGYIYAAEMTGPQCPWTDLVVAAWSKALGTAQRRPGVIAIRRPEWISTLTPLAAQLGITLELRDELPFIDEAGASLARFGMR
ncbi:MAG: hypothetical protein HYV95_14115 [Opitutae bacterium]|nr:hypothetical protein [Opitutae bacterium]